MTLQHEMVRTRNYQLFCPNCNSIKISKIENEIGWYHCSKCNCDYMEVEYNERCPFLLRLIYPIKRDTCSLFTKSFGFRKAIRMLCPKWDYGNCPNYIEAVNPELAKLLNGENEGVEIEG